jgi:hypothetical protein
MPGMIEGAGTLDVIKRCLAYSTWRSAQPPLE